MIHETIRALAKHYGFAHCHFSQPKIDHKQQQALQHWIDQQYYAGMQWMAEEERLQRRMQPQSILQGACTVLSLAMPYQAPTYSLSAGLNASDRGLVSAYAQARDYHHTVKKQLKALAQALDAQFGKHEQRVFVDTAPILEHALAASSGMAWQGKHSLSLNRTSGSWFFLAELFTTMNIAPDQPASEHCGSCHACLDACPTQAIVAPYVVDARRCLSYWNIEHQGMIPKPMRKAMGNRIYGCDDCQMVCPWNKKQTTLELEENIIKHRKEMTLIDLETVFSFDEKDFRLFFKQTPMLRLKRSGLLRNIAIAMGNAKQASFIPALIKAAKTESAIIRAHSLWALAELHPYQSQGEIERLFDYTSQYEKHPDVLHELSDAQQTIQNRGQA